MFTPDDIVAEARGYLGTPYHHQGRVRGVGVDCAGLVLNVGKAIGALPPDLDMPGYNTQPHIPQVNAILADHSDELPLREARPGDILRVAVVGTPQHFAIKTDIGMIHAYSPAGGVVEHRIDRKWARRLFAAHRYRRPE